MKILITRPVEDGLRTCERLATIGHEGVLLPIARIEATDAPVPSDGADALIATSANALRMLDQDTLRRFVDCPIFCVGQKTASLATSLGFKTVHRGAGDGHALVALLSAHQPKPHSLLYLTGTPRKPYVEETLQARSLRFTVIELYKSVADPLWPHDHRDLVASCTAAMHFSRASVEMLVRAVDQQGLASAFSAMTHLCLSHDVATPLVTRGYAHVHSASEPNEEALFALMIRVNET